MVCIYCGGKTHIYNSRGQKRPNKVWRRRKCLTCQATFTSLEAPDFTTSLLVHKHKQTPSRFERDKLFLSLYNCCKHRPDAVRAASALTDTIMGKLSSSAQNASIDTATIRNEAAKTLKRFDKAAYVQYSAYHRG